VTAVPDHDDDHSSLDALVAQLDLGQKLRLVAGRGMFSMAGLPEIGLRPMVLSDGPSGVRGEHWDERDPSVSLPSGTALAATWDPELIGRLGALVAAEAGRKGVDVVLGPTINLHRSPLGGRHFECLSEDPVLTAAIATAYVRGVQDHGVGACPKHYVANDAETERFTVDVRVDEATLHELYLLPFEATVAAGAWMVMAAYNAVDGTTMTESPLLDEPLKGSWGFDGVVVSDWTAVRSTEGAARGTDLAMPGPSKVWGEPLRQAVLDGRVPEAAIDDKVRRILRLAARVGALDDRPRSAPVPAPAPVLSDAEAADLGREAAAQAMVLVRNDGILPLDRTGDARLALLGPGASEPRIQGGGSATVLPTAIVTPLQALTGVLGDVAVAHTPGVRLREGLSPVPLDLVTDPETGEPGLHVRYLDGDGTVVAEENRRTGRLVWMGGEALAASTVVEVHGRLTADVAGEWQLGMAGVGPMTLAIDGEEAVSDRLTADADDPAAFLTDPPWRTVTRRLAAGDVVDVVVRHQHRPGTQMLSLVVGAERPQRSEDEEMAAAVALAAGSDVAVVVVGTTDKIESEGVDRTTLRLPGRQDELVAAVARANPRTVVVVNAGSPVEMPWREDVAAVLLMWFPGQEGGAALADVLLGEVEPGGRLPTTWPRTMADVPVLSTTPVDGTLTYAEGTEVGYRAWLAGNVEPAWWFGHGLGYTTWAYDAVVAPDRVTPGDDLGVTVRVRNTGDRSGSEVVQAYLSSSGEPPRLAAFIRVTAAPGDQVDVELTLPTRAFQRWEGGDWRPRPGPFTLHVGPSVAATPLTHTFASMV
jgi:beta-glucosidase